MGNCLSTSRPPAVNRKNVCKPKPWAHPEPITEADLDRLRREFWARPYRRGRTYIWEALKAAARVEPPIAQVILEANDIFHQFNDLTVCRDNTGRGYELPLYCLSEPTNLIRNN